MWLAWPLIALIRLLVGANARHNGVPPLEGQTIYFANHTSHIDTVALWSALPPAQRRRTRPVAAGDYWGKGPLRRFLALRVLNAVLVDRHAAPVPGQDKLQPLRAALSQGDSLIIFPEGTRQQGSVPAEFKSGLYHLAQDFPNVQLAPVYLENLHRSMPKGFTVPVPVICTVRFGSTLERRENEPKASFLDRARNAVIALS